MSEITIYRDPNRRPGFYALSKIYDPDLPDPSEERIIPEIQSLIIDDDGSLFWVMDLNETTFKVTLEPANIVVSDLDQGNQISIVDYGNNVLRIYTDARNAPTRLQPDSRLVIYGNAASYRLVLNKGESTEKVVSRYYDTDGQFTSTMVPMAPVLTDLGEPAGMSYGTACHTLDALPNGTKLTMEIFNDHGALVATVTTFTFASAIVNETAGYRPQITELKMVSAQPRSNDEFFLYEQQDPDSLNVQVYLVYDDGQEVFVPVDNEKCFIYGLEDFNASWQGLRQPIMAKYYLHSDEVVAPGVTDTSFVVAEATIVVIPNEAGAGVKISMVPQWVNALGRYVPSYFMYTTDRESVRNVTAHVTFDEGNFVGNLYSTYQVLKLALDLNAIDPIMYDQTVIHRQDIAIRLQPVAALERYVIRDTLQSPLIYGIDEPNSRRPVIHYDTDLQQYFIPSSIFLTKEAMLNSFFTKAGVPYDAENEAGPPEPTHFTIRDVNTGAMVISAPIPIDDYATAWTVTGVNKDRFVDSLFLVEFIHEVDISTQLVLYGAGVDCYASTTGYIE